MNAITSSTAIEVLTMSLQGEIFALPAAIVSEILDFVPITEVPNAQPFVGGLINVRGKVVPLADLKVKFGMAPSERTSDTRIVVVELDLGGEPTIIGLLADKVYEVTSISTASIEDAPQIGMNWRPDFVSGIGKRGDDFIIIPHIECIFTAV